MPFHPVECDGFDNYSDVIERWTLGGNGECSLTASRHSWGQGVRFGFTDQIMIEHPPLNQVIHEFAYRIHALGPSGGTLPIFRLGKLFTTSRSHVSIRLSESNHPWISRDDGSGNVSEMLAPPVTGPEHILEVGNWYWVAILAGIHESSGYVQLRVNNSIWIDVPIANTFNSGAFGTPTDDTRRVDYLRMGEFPLPTTDLDDWVCQDGSDGEIQGDMVVIGKRPISAGYITQFTPNTGTNHGAVDEINADEDTTYVASSTIGHRDSYIIDDITEVPESSIVLGVQQAFRHRKDEPGPRSVTGFIRVDTDEVLGEERFPSETSYLTSIETVHILQPDGVSAWGTVGEFNDLDVEIGQETGDGFDDESS